MAKIRHIAYRAHDVDQMVGFFVNGFGMTVAERRKNGAVDISDGSVNITVLPMALARPDGRPMHAGIEHIGFTVEDDAAGRSQVESAGGVEMNTINMGDAHYEVKYEGPEGIVVDIGHWAGTAPVGEELAAHAAR